MKCALDFITMKAVATEEWEKEEAIKDTLAIMAYETLKPRSIDFCESTIDELFTQKALQREPLEHYFKGFFNIDRVNQITFIPLVEDGHVYQNGEKSLKKGNVSLAYDTIKEFLESHCFKVERVSSSYRHYGSGSCRCEAIRVYIPKVEG